MKTRVLFIAWSILLLGCAKNEVSPEPTSTVYHNGDILTMAGDAPNYVEALVAQTGKIVFVGDKEEAMKSYPKAETRDLNGKTLMPGFIDGHAHFANFSIQSIGAQILPPPDAEAKDLSLIHI